MHKIVDYRLSKRRYCERAKTRRQERAAFIKYLKDTGGYDDYLKEEMFRKLHSPTRTVSIRARRTCDGRYKMKLGDFPLTSQNLK